MAKATYQLHQLCLVQEKHHTLKQHDQESLPTLKTNDISIL